MLIDLRVADSGFTRKIKGKKIAVLPIGSFEYHGGNLPLNTDAMIAEKLAEKCALRHADNSSYTLLLFPAIIYGYSIEWGKYPGTISLDASVMVELLDSIINSVEKNIGPEGYLFINGHGGNYSILEIFSREKYYELSKPFIILDVWKIASLLGVKYCHACSFEILLYKELTSNEPGNRYGEIIGSGDSMCRDKYIRGYYKELGIGGYYSSRIRIEDFINVFCGSFDKAVKIIIDQK